MPRAFFINCMRHFFSFVADSGKIFYIKTVVGVGRNNSALSLFFVPPRLNAASWRKFVGLNEKCRARFFINCVRHFFLLLPILEKFFA
ncbi:MAG: hypothetical protein DBX55_09910 [Verrucomicrobia bacterium]|nr:MAG: hypothetical protein DBX55_09910 [Verrucomicrobiota bacterium]